MKNPQVISIAGESPDAVIAIWGEMVIKNSDPGAQTIITTHPSIQVDLSLYDVRSGSTVSVSNLTMTYRSASKFWTIPIAGTLAGALTDRHKYVGRVSMHTGDDADMREFFLDEFAVDNNSFEESLMRLPYDIRTISSQLYIVWYDTNAHMIAGNLSYAKFKAPVYEGGTGSTSATDPSRITHRGAAVPY